MTLTLELGKQSPKQPRTNAVREIIQAMLYGNKQATE